MALSKLKDVWVDAQNQAYRIARSAAVPLGAQSTSIFIQLDSTSLLRSLQGAFSPTTIEASAYTQVDGAVPTAYLGRFVVSESDDGFVYTPIYTSSVDESSHVYTPTSTSILKVRFSLYLTGGTTTLLDSIDLYVTGASELDSVYANNAPPTNNLTNLAFSNEKNSDGSVNVTATWSYTQGVAQADGFLLYFPSGSAALGSIDPVNDPHVFIPGDARSYTLAAIAAYSLPGASDALVRHYRFGMIAVGLRSSGIVPATGGIVEHADWIDKTFASSTISASEGGSTLSVEGQSLVWRNSVSGVELARIRNDVALTMLKASNLAALVKYRGSWYLDPALPTSTTAVWAAYSTVEASNCNRLAALTLQNGTQLCIYRDNASPYYLKLKENSGSPTTLYAGHVSFNAALTSLADGAVVCIFSDATSYQLYQIERATNGTWGLAAPIGSEQADMPAVTCLANGSLLLVYRDISSNFLFYKTRTATGSWSTATQLEAVSSISPSLCALADGRVLCGYIDSSTEYARLKIRSSAGVWGAYSVIESVTAHTPSLLALPDGQVLLSYVAGTGYLKQKIYTLASTWTASAALENVSSETPVLMQLANASIACVYIDTTTKNIRQKLSTSAYSAIPLKDDYALVGSGIVEVGQNSNGTYIKFGDGTLECRFMGPFSVNGGYIGTWYFPYAMIDTSYTIFGGSDPINQFGFAGAMAESGYWPQLTYSAIRVSRAASNTLYIHLRAIGRWK
jgi:hypothetical protein